MRTDGNAAAVRSKRREPGAAGPVGLCSEHEIDARASETSAALTRRRRISFFEEGGEKPVGKRARDDVRG